MDKRIEELVEQFATYLEQYSKDVRALHRNPNHFECENTVKELLSESPALALIDQTCFTYPETGKKLAYVIPLKENDG